MNSYLNGAVSVHWSLALFLTLYLGEVCSFSGQVQPWDITARHIFLILSSELFTVGSHKQSLCFLYKVHLCFLCPPQRPPSFPNEVLLLMALSYVEPGKSSKCVGQVCFHQFLSGVTSLALALLIH